MEMHPFSGKAEDWPIFAPAFKMLIYDKCSNDAERMYHLRTLLPKDIKDSLGSALLHPSMFNYAMQELQRKYGSPHLVSMDCFNRLSTLPTLKEDDLPALKRFSSTVRGAVATLAYNGHGVQLECYPTLLSLLNKLPSGLRREWGKRSYSIESTGRRQPTLADFDQWLDTIFMEEQRAQPLTATSSSSRSKDRAPTRTGYSHSIAEAKKLARTGAAKHVPFRRRSCFACKADHRLDACARFKALDVEKRADLIRKNKGCWRCLDNGGDGHSSRLCPRPKKKCPTDDCKFHHHPLMHGASFAPRPVGAATPGDVPVSMLTLSNWAGDRDLYGSLPIVPVIVKSNGVEVHTFALLDQGSQVSLIHNSIAGQLNLKGPKRKTLTGTFHGNDPVIVTRRVNFELLSVDGISSFQVKQAESPQHFATANRLEPHQERLAAPQTRSNARGGYSR
jgi:hypothetical protein